MPRDLKEYIMVYTSLPRYWWAVRQSSFPDTIRHFNTHSVVVNMPSKQSDHQVGVKPLFNGINKQTKKLSAESRLHTAHTNVLKQTCWSKLVPNWGCKRARWNLATYTTSRCPYSRWVVFTTDYTPQVRDIIVTHNAVADHSCWLRE